MKENKYLNLILFILLLVLENSCNSKTRNYTQSANISIRIEEEKSPLLNDIYNDLEKYVLINDQTEFIIKSIDDINNLYSMKKDKSISIYLKNCIYNNKAYIKLNLEQIEFENLVEKEYELKIANEILDLIFEYKQNKYFIKNILYKLPFILNTKDFIAELIEKRFNIIFSKNIYNLIQTFSQEKIDPYNFRPPKLVNDLLIYEGEYPTAFMNKLKTTNCCFKQSTKIYCLKKITKNLNNKKKRCLIENSSKGIYHSIFCIYSLIFVPLLILLLLPFIIINIDFLKIGKSGTFCVGEDGIIDKIFCCWNILPCHKWNRKIYNRDAEWEETLKNRDISKYDKDRWHYIYKEI